MCKLPIFEVFLDCLLLLYIVGLAPACVGCQISYAETGEEQLGRHRNGLFPSQPK